MNRAIASKVCGLMVAISLSAFAENLKSPTQAGRTLSLKFTATTSFDETATPALDPVVYRHVDQVTWIVSDVDRVVGYWEQLEPFLAGDAPPCKRSNGVALKKCIRPDQGYAHFFARTPNSITFPRLCGATHATFL